MYGIGSHQVSIAIKRGHGPNGIISLGGITVCGHGSCHIVNKNTAPAIREIEGTVIIDCALDIGDFLIPVNYIALVQQIDILGSVGNGRGFAAAYTRHCGVSPLPDSQATGLQFGSSTAQINTNAHRLCRIEEISIVKAIVDLFHLDIPAALKIIVREHHFASIVVILIAHHKRQLG